MLTAFAIASVIVPSAVTPFPAPAHRTGRADFPHPALRRRFMPGPRSCQDASTVVFCTPSSPNTLLLGNWRVAREATLWRLSCFALAYSLFGSVRIFSGVTRPISSQSPCPRFLPKTSSKSGPFARLPLRSFIAHTGLSDSPPVQRLLSALPVRPGCPTGDPTFTHYTLSGMPPPLPRRTQQVHTSISYPAAHRPSPLR